MNLENFIWNNHIDNAGGLTIRIRFIGSSSGVYDPTKHEKQKENKKNTESYLLMLQKIIAVLESIVKIDYKFIL